MEEEKRSFGSLVFRRAWFSAWRFFESWEHDLPIGLASFAIGEWSYYSGHGLPASMIDGLNNLGHLIAPAACIWLLLFIWHLWLAPAALAYEAHRSDLERWSASGLPPKTTLADARSKALAGTLRRMGESAGRAHFKGLALDSTPYFDFTEIMQSAHPIWTRQDAAQLRRDFENQVGRLAEANKESDQKARMEVKVELELTISNLSNILLGNA